LLVFEDDVVESVFVEICEWVEGGGVMRFEQSVD
jgi:hypothetical protein